MNKIKLFIFVLFLTSLSLLFTPKALAYTDFSYHRIKTGDFYGEDSAKKGVERLASEIGWWSEYNKTGSLPYYKVYSGNYYSQLVATNIANQFQTSTGLKANPLAVGPQLNYQKVLSGYFYGEENVKNAVKELTASTGVVASYELTGNYTMKEKYIINDLNLVKAKGIVDQLKASTGIIATYEATGNFLSLYRFVSGGFYGETAANSALKEFTSVTGQSATLEPTQWGDALIITTGEFYGETTVKSVITKIKSQLGIDAIYEASSTNSYRIKFAPMVGENFTKVTNFLNREGYWYETKAAGHQLPTHFRFVSQHTVQIEQLQKIADIYKLRNWWGTIEKTGQSTEPYYRVITPALNLDQKQKVIGYASTNKLAYEVQSTSEKDYSYYRIVTEPLLENLSKVTSFFEKRGWWYTTQTDSKVGYKAYQVVVDPLYVPSQIDKALQYFSRNGLWATAEATGTSINTYQLVTGYFQGYANTVANATYLTNKFGWWTTTEKVQSGPLVKYTDYLMTLDEMLSLQMKQTPQTDKYRNDPAYVHSAYVNKTNNTIVGSGVNVRSGPGTNYSVVAQLNNGFNGFTVVGTEGEWVKISLTWKNATSADVLQYLNPNNFPSDNIQYFQFLKLSQPAEINVAEVNQKILNANAGVMNGKASVFVQAAQQYSINELYLIAHALHETGNGTSQLAKGVSYNGKIVYNMYGYGAYDSCAVTCGAKKAYEEGWFTPEAAIIGGAKLIGSGYIFNTTFQQDTLYKMRWNPLVTYHQYATDIGWAYKQVQRIYNYYQLLDNYTLYIDLPVYR
jgi:mannosyl-glycoprotein endo-beta-N-acetylglucosaminidase